MMKMEFTNILTSRRRNEEGIKNVTVNPRKCIKIVVTHKNYKSNNNTII